MFKRNIAYRALLLLIFPAVFLVLQILIKIDYRYFFLSSHDPAYGYLFNGLDLACGNFQLGLFAHPGTPLHLLVALNLLAGKVFLGASALQASVMANPEFYLNIISYELLVMNTLALWFLGKVMFTRTGKLTLSLALQLTPFASVQGFCFDSIVMLEPILLCIELILLIQFSFFAFDRKYILKGKSLFSTAVLVGLGNAAKVVFLPVYVLPLFMVQGGRKKLVFTGWVILTFVVFLAPVYGVFSSFVAWIRDLFVHTGIYGAGSPDIIDFPVFFANIGAIFRSNLLFSTSFFMVFVAAFLSFLPRFRNARQAHLVKTVRALAVVFMLNIMMVAKHFSIHYLIMSHNLVIFALLVVLSLVISWSGFQIKAFGSKRSGMLLVFTAGLLLLCWLIPNIRFSPRLNNARMKSLAFVEHTVRNTPRIIVLESPGPFRETALFHGMSFSGGMKSRYAEILKNDYPATYFYDISQNRFMDWNNEINPVELFSYQKYANLYYTSRHDTLPKAISEVLDDLIRKKYLISVKAVFHNAATSEYIYALQSDTVKLRNSMMEYPLTECGFERISADGHTYLADDLTRTFEGATLRSSESSYSGVYSLKLNHENPYGGKTALTLKRGFYEITVMRKSAGFKGLIVITDKSGKGFYRASESAMPDRQGWEKVTLVVNVDASLEGKDAVVYLWYPGRKTCYFDNLKIIFHEVKQDGI